MPPEAGSRLASKKWGLNLEWSRGASRAQCMRKQSHVSRSAASFGAGVACVLKEALVALSRRDSRAHVEALDLNLRELAESAFGDIFPERAFLAPLRAPRLGAILKP